MNVFEIGVVVSLVDKASAGLGSMMLGFKKSETAANALQKRLDKIGSVYRTGLTQIAGGMALAAPLIYASKKAEELEFALNRVQTATGSNGKEMEAFSQKLSKVANMTGVFSKPMLAEFAYSMKESGISSLKDITTLLPLFAKGADVLQVLSKGRMSPETTAHTFSALAHHYGYYKANQMQPIIDTAVALAPSTPGGVATFARMGSNIDIFGSRILGMKPAQIMALETTIAQTVGSGGAGKGALSSTNVMNALKRSMPGVIGSGMMHGASAYSASVMGLADKRGFSTIMKNGHLDLNTLMTTMAMVSQGASTAGGRVALAKRMLENVNKLPKGQAKDARDFAENVLKAGGVGVSPAQFLTKLLQQQAGSGSGVLALFGDPAFQAMLKKNTATANNSAGATDKMQAQISQSTHFQKMRAATNIETLSSSFGMAMLPLVKKAAIFIADMADKLNTFIEKHPRMTQAITGLIALGAGLLIVGGTINVIAAGFMGLQVIFGPMVGLLTGIVSNFTFISGLLSGPLGLVISVVTKFIPQIAILSLIIGGIYLVVTHWSDIMKVVQPIIDKVTGAFKNMIPALSNLMIQLGGFIAMVPGMAPMGTAMKIAGEAAKNALKATNKPGITPGAVNQMLAGLPMAKPKLTPTAPIAQSQHMHHGALINHLTMNVHAAPGCICARKKAGRAHPKKPAVRIQKSRAAHLKKPVNKVLATRAD